MDPVERIVVVGGGTAGWLAAGTIAAGLRRLSRTGATVTLVQAPEIATVGVGEGTWPTIRSTLAAMGIAEPDFLLSCEASLKQGSRFDGWSTGAPGDSYYHPFTPPPAASPREIVSAWQRAAPDSSFAHAVTVQADICDKALAPRQRDMPDWSAPLNYAYHLDAAKLGGFLADHSVRNLGVRHVADRVESVEPDGAGGIAAIVTRDNGRIEGDLFIDCTGQSALLIGGALDIPFVDRSNHAFNDRALVVQVPVEPGSRIESQTIGTAHKAGWTWDIGLSTRRGVGCVYSSAFMSDDEAAAELRAYLKHRPGAFEVCESDFRRLSFATGHRAEFWRGNCLAIGLSAGFIEPLEASSIVLAELSVKALMDNFPESRAAMPIHARRFNALFLTRWDRVVEFLKLHYALSRRTEPYWIAQRDPASLPGRLADLIRLWSDQPPSSYDLPLVEEIFPAASYQYVWYGMGGALPHAVAAPTVEAQIGQLRQRSRALASALPSNRGYLDALHSAQRKEGIATAS